MSSIQPLVQDDWPEVRRIYLEGIATGLATFETEAPSWESWHESHHAFGRFVLKLGSQVHGWSALSKVSAREVYRGVAEVSVYVATESRGQGFGRLLLEALIQDSERNGVWTLQASIFPENIASIELHRRCGFREVGRRDKIGKLQNVWRDTLLMERRSAVVGTG